MSQPISKLLGRQIATLILAMWLSLVPAAAEAQLDSANIQPQAVSLAGLLDAAAHGSATVPQASAVIGSNVQDVDRGSDPAIAGTPGRWTRFVSISALDFGLPPATAPPSDLAATANQARAPPLR